MATDRVKYWTEIADYDLGTAETLYEGGRWLYVAFMCHQAIEKTLKAYWCSLIEPILMEEGSHSPLYDDVMRTGIAV